MTIKRKYLASLALTTLFVSTLFFSSCNESETSSNDAFDRGLLLENIANQLIVPNFEQLQSSVENLTIAVSTFNQISSETNLNALREAWTTAVKDYQHCSAFGFGPGSLPLGPFATVIGVFPVNESQVEANIINPDFDLQTSFFRDIRGFYTIEYLIYGNGTSDADLISGFDTHRKTYLNLVTTEIESIIDGIVSEWNSTYLQAFTSNTGTSAGSPISSLYNEFVKDYENLKNFKVELPAGLTAGQSGSDPTLVEAYYSGISTDLITAHFQNSKNIWAGRSRTGADFVGFEEYLEEVVGGEDLIAMTNQSINEIDAAIAAIPSGPLADHVESTEVATLRNVLQSNTANFKSSLSSLIGISITFNSGDGD